MIMTKQGRNVNYSDIILYTKNNKKIIALVNDEAQMSIFTKTGKQADAPIAVLPYSLDELNAVISGMKKIDSYEELDNGVVRVNYNDETSIMFSNTELPTIKENKESQENLKVKEGVVSSWATMSDAEKEDKRRKTKKNVTKGLAGVLAATVIAGSLYSCSKFGKKTIKNDNKETTSSYDEFINPTDPRKDMEIVVEKSDFTKEAEELYNLTETVNPFILKYQQTADVKWTKELALEVVEYLNGIYPTAMEYMSEEDAYAEAIEIEQAISLIIAGNLNAENTTEQMIDLSKFIMNEEEKAMVNNAMIVARNCINESIGEPMNGKIIETDEEINKFSKDYTDSVSKLLNYEFETVNQTEFLTSSSGIRYTITNIFFQIDSSIPQWSYIDRKSSETDKREYRLYYRYFFDDYEKIEYLPEPGKNGTNVYYAHYTDDENKCKVEGPYTEDVMHAMAGLTVEDTGKTYNIEANPNIRRLGIQTEVESRFNEATNEFLELTTVNSKTK